ncbi:MAG TPA: hypothetical protein VNW29_04255 [Candidatus Sulfotelmatobacter sp.]|jgi:hypothetical protein|nr:hypothetical protein [Candidatus Sulfotelmatobacter sp.]
MSIHEVVTTIAKLGGYLARKSDGPPGIRIGFQTLQHVVYGILMAEKLILFFPSNK